MQTNTIQGPSWDLSDEYSSCEDPQIQADLDQIDQILAQVEALNLQLAQADAVAVAQTIAKCSDQVNILLGNVSTFSHCLLSVDSQHEQALALKGRLQRYYKRCGDLFEPLSQYVDGADDITVASYLADPEVAPREFLTRHQRARRHENLSLSEESIVNGLSQDGVHAWGNLYDQLAGTLKCQVMVGNEEQEMGIAEANTLMSSADDMQRQHAWRAVGSAWRAHEESCAAALNAIAGWRLEMCKQRSRERDVHYLDAPVHANRIGKATLDTILDVAKTNRPLAQRAAALQARAYGKAGFGPWDLRAPAPELQTTEEERLTFEEAIELIAQAYAQVDASMGEFVHMMAQRQWIEGTVGPNKSPGAYCTGFSKSATPRVYMTYTGSFGDVVTLAHELGHAYHGWVMRDLPLTQKSYGMSLAETASTFGETLVRQALLERATGIQNQLNILWEDVSALTAYMLNIPTRYEFESRFYDARAERPLRPEELRTFMSEAWQTWYGDALAEPDPMFWASKLHFYISGLSFYNFPYLFGYLFSLGVYAQRELQGAQFFSNYVELLRDTGRMTAEDLAHKHLGADLTQPQFWQQSVDLIAPCVDRFEMLLDDAGVA